MSLRKLNICEIFAVLVHGGFILQKRPIMFGSCQYFVMCPDKCRDATLGYVTEKVVCDLWDSGLIIGKDALKQDGDFINTSFILKKSTLNELFESLNKQ